MALSEAVRSKINLYTSRNNYQIQKFHEMLKSSNIQAIGFNAVHDDENIYYDDDEDDGDYEDEDKVNCKKVGF